jgi:hypothetical protein
VSRHKTTVQIVMVAATLLLIAGTPAAARGVVEGHAKPRVTRQEQPVMPAMWRWLRVHFKRYAMAAN